jgi:hypothetical protein
LDFLRGGLLGAGTIDSLDCERLIVTDSAAQAVESVRATALRQFGLTYGARPRRHWLLGE